ncbi:MAG: hypothetical protein ABI771_09030 [Betaproteobacteria bacterium]
MISLSDEVLLMLLVAGLYLYDSALLLFANEGILVPAAKGWKIRFGLRAPRIAGKELFVPAPWLLHRPMYRLSWRFEGGALQHDMQDRDTKRHAPPILVLLVWSIAMVLFVLLPIGFFTSLGARVLIAGAGLLYLSIVFALLYLWAYREAMGLTGKQIGKLAFEYLTCPPFSLNLIRAVSLAQPAREDLVSASRRLQTPEAWDATREQLLFRLDEEIEMEDEGSKRMDGLRHQRAMLAE